MATLAELMQTLPEPVQARGRAFERVCQWYLLHSPLYAAQLQRVWLWADWPERWGADSGIDLVAETHSGELWAVQAKAYAPETSITKASVDSFLSESARSIFSFRLLLGTTDAIGHNARQAFHGQQIPAALRLLGDLASEPLEWPASVDELRAPAMAQAVPRPHQAEALAAIVRGLAAGGRGRVIMACGTGKTFVQLWAHEQLRSSRTLVLVPSLFLVQQSLQEWTTNRTRPFALLAVCSDETVADSDSFTTDVTALGVPVTTDALRIREFLAGPGDRVVFCTYQSSGRVAEAMQGEPLRFELVLCDEAHQLAGAAGREFATALRAEAIPADRRIFFTATPRYFTGALQGSGAQRDLAVASMDDAAVFGSELHRLSFGEAIKRELLSDYRVVVLGVTDREALQLAQQGTYMDFAEGTTDARSLGREIGLARAMKTYDLHRVISFHSRVQAAKNFAAHLPKVIAALPKARAPRGKLLFDYISGQMPTGERRTRLNRFRAIGADEYALLANARCLSEGVDVPAIDGVAFIDPRKSQVDIIQAVGRAIRLSAQKVLGTIVIPVFVPEGADPQAVLAGSAFEPVWAVVRALRDHDEELADQLDGLRRKLGRERKLTSKQLSKKIVLDLRGMAVSAAFLDAFTTRVVERVTSPWEEHYSHLLEFVKREGHAQVPSQFVSLTGARLGKWVRVQRHAHNKNSLDSYRVGRLQLLQGWLWEVVDSKWEIFFAELEEYSRRERHACVPGGYTTATGLRLGGWVSQQRTTYIMGRISEARCKRLEALPGWVWDAVTALWETGYLHLVEFTRREGHARVTSNYRTQDSFLLGVWASRQRHNRAVGKLESARCVRLDSLPGWVWEIRDHYWESGFRQLVDYAARMGHLRVSKKFRTEDGFRLAGWIDKQRIAYRANTLGTERSARLEGVTGWTWDPFDEQWELGFAQFALYCKQTGNAIVPRTSLTRDGFKLGIWISVQRKEYRKGKLRAERVARIQTLGLVWDPNMVKWEEELSQLHRYYSSEGTAAVPGNFVTDSGFKLGIWVNLQRIKFSKGKLIPSMVTRLEELPGWVWGSTQAEQWETGYTQLIRYVAHRGHAVVPSSFITKSGFRLGGWVGAQRRSYKSGTLPVQNISMLEATEGWVWGQEKGRWDEGWGHLIAFRQREGNVLVPANHIASDGFRLGKWVVVQRHSYGKRSLSNERISQLESIEGWVWDQIQAQWDQKLARLEEFAQREGHALMPNSYKTKDGITLGSWCNTQRVFYRKGKLSADRIARLEALPGWVWKTAK